MYFYGTIGDVSTRMQEAFSTKTTLGCNQRIPPINSLTQSMAVTRVQ